LAKITLEGLPFFKDVADVASDNNIHRKDSKTKACKENGYFGG